MQDKFPTLRERFLKARSTKEKDAIYEELRQLIVTNPDEAFDFFSQEANDIAHEAVRLAVKDELEPVLKIIPAGYIAKEFFGRSSGWFSQRLNGHEISSGKAHFTHSEILKIQESVQAIGRQLANFKFSEDIVKHK